MHEYPHDLIEKIQQRPGLYLGKNSISRLDSFLAGYGCALFEDGFVQEESTALFPLPFQLFHDYVARCFHYSSSTSGWCNMILAQVNHDEEKGLELFIDLYNKFYRLHAASCCKTALSKDNVSYALNHGPKLVTVPDFSEKPMYKNPEAAYVVALSDKVGYLVLIETEQNMIMSYGILKSKQQANAYLKMCFDNVSNLEKVDVERLSKSGKTITCL